MRTMENGTSQTYLNSLINFAEVKDLEGVVFALRRLETHLASDIPLYVANGLRDLRYLVDLGDYQAIKRRASLLRNELDSREVQAV